MMFSMSNDNENHHCLAGGRENVNKNIFGQFLSVVIVVQFMFTVTAGCSNTGSDVSGEPSEFNHTIEIVDFADRSVSFDHVPERIVALGNGEVDLITALGGTIVGRPSSNTDNVRDDLRDVPVIGSVHTVDLEKITVLPTRMLY